MGTTLVLVVDVVVALGANVRIGPRKLGCVGDVINPHVTEDAIEIGVHAVREIVLEHDQPITWRNLRHIHDVRLGVAEKALLVSEIYLPAGRERRTEAERRTPSRLQTWSRRSCT